MISPDNTLCTQTVHPSLGALSGKQVEASLAGHSCPAALFSLAILRRSQ